MKRILVVKMRSLGDVVLAAPVFEGLRRTYPTARISLLTSPPAHELLKETGWADEVFVYGKQVLDRQPLVIRWLKEFRVIQGLRSRRFDLAIDLYGSHRSARLVRASRAGIQMGLDLPETKGFYHVRAEASDRVKVSARILDLRVAEMAGIVDTGLETIWPVSGEAEREAAAFCASQGISEEDLLVTVNPFASCVTKEWHPRKWGKLVAELMSVGIRVVLTCAPLERKRLAEIDSAVGCRVPAYTGASLRPLLGIYRRSRVVVSCDSGPRHLAAAVGTPTLTIWGPELPARWHPYDAQKHPIAIREVPCRPCGLSVCIERNHECMVRLEVGEVLKVLKRLLRDVPERSKKGRAFDRTL
jgi:ADP-heptose:LPS heptosyltransferase